MSQAFHRGEYPADWEAIATAVKDAADWRCVRCWVLNNRETGHVLTVHHFNGDKACCERWNLMALCQRCHLSVQARVDPNMPLMFDPSPWSLPYIAGFYEAGHGIPSPLYDLARWISDYRRDIGQWPDWAPNPTNL